MTPLEKRKEKLKYFLDARSTMEPNEWLLVAAVQGPIIAEQLLLAIEALEYIKSYSVLPPYDFCAEEFQDFAKKTLDIIGEK